MRLQSQQNFNKNTNKYIWAKKVEEKLSPQCIKSVNFLDDKASKSKNFYKNRNKYGQKRKEKNCLLNALNILYFAITRLQSQHNFFFQNFH